MYQLQYSYHLMSMSAKRYGTTAVCGCVFCDFASFLAFQYNRTVVNTGEHRPIM